MLPVEDVESPESCKDVEDDISQERSLHQLEGLGDADGPGHDRRHENAGAEKFTQK